MPNDHKMKNLKKKHEKVTCKIELFLKVSTSIEFKKC